MSDVHLDDKTRSDANGTKTSFRHASVGYRPQQQQPPQAPPVPTQPPFEPAREPASLQETLAREVPATTYPRVQSAPVAMRTVALLEMIQRTNDFLANSAPEFKLARWDRCQELEYYLIRTYNFQGFEFLEPNVNDPSRRRYMIPNRLLVSIAG